MTTVANIFSYQSDCFSLYRLPDELIRRILIFSQDYNTFKVCKRFQKYCNSLEFKALFLGLGTRNFQEIFSEKTINHKWFNEDLAMAFLRLGGVVSFDNFRILQWACANSFPLTDLIISKYLCKLSIDINMSDGIFLRRACARNQIENVRLLLKAGIDLFRFGKASFIDAVARDNVEVLSLLLDSGMDVHFDQDRALREASLVGSTGAVELLLGHGADVHAFNESSLLSACHKGHDDIVALLINYGADIDFNCGSALRFSSSQGHLHVVDLLLQKGIDTIAFQCGEKALRDSARKGHYDIVRRLAKHGVSCSSLNCSALLCAILNGHTQIARFLLEHGATPDFNSLEFKRYQSSFVGKNIGGLLQEFDIQV